MYYFFYFNSKIIFLSILLHPIIKSESPKNIKNQEQKIDEQLLKLINNNENLKSKISQTNSFERKINIGQSLINNSKKIKNLVKKPYF